MATQSITFCVPNVEIFSAARGAAASIFHLIERQPKIDSLQEVGRTPRRVIGDIILEDVHFSYPSRSEVKVIEFYLLICYLRWTIYYSLGTKFSSSH